MTNIHIVKTFTKKGGFTEIKENGKSYLVCSVTLPESVFKLLYSSAKIKSIALYSDGTFSVLSFFSTKERINK